MGNIGTKWSQYQNFLHHLHHLILCPQTPIICKKKKKNPDFFITLETPQQKSFHYTLNPKTKTITKQSKTKTKQHKKTNQ